jgi:hypothetical protein
MSFAPIQVLALVTRSMEMKLPMQVYLHEVPLLRAIYAGQVEVLHMRQAEDILDGQSEMERLSRTYGTNPQKQPWAEALFGAYGAGAVALESMYDDAAAGVRADLLGDAKPFPGDPEAFEHAVTGATVVPNVADIGTAQEAKAKDKKPAAKKAKKTADADA